MTLCWSGSHLCAFGGHTLAHYLSLDGTVFADSWSL
jgi:hypothetical protein